MRRRLPGLPRPAALLVLLLAVTGLTVPGTGPAAAGGVPPSGTAPAIGSEQALFRAGTGGYGCFRIPALVRTKAGSLLAFAEAREAPSCGDRGDIDIVVRRSVNDGRTWGPVRVVPAGDVAPQAGGTAQAGAAVTRGNAAPVVDLRSGRISLLSTSNPANSSYPRIPWVQDSTDDGLTWSAPRRIGADLGAGTASGTWWATGPGHGIQLTEGPHAGRLVVGAHQVQASTGKYFGGYLYLDPQADGSGEWKAAAATGTASPEPSEVAVAEQSGGDVRLVARDEAKGPRLTAVSTTPADAATPSVPAFAAGGGALTPPGATDVQASVLRLHTAAADGVDELLMAAPANAGRNDMTLWSACGGSWRGTGTAVSASRGGYSDLALLQDGEIGLLYEGGSTYSMQEIRFDRFAESALGSPCGAAPRAAGSVQVPPQPGPTTPDASPEASDAYLYGGAGLGDGKLAGVWDKSLSLTGTGYADVPYSRSVDPADGDFTYALWFRHTATPATADRVLFWAYGYGAGVPQVWLRARPGPDHDDLYAGVQGSGGSAYVSVKDASATSTAFGDGLWHHVALTRAGGRITLTVDGGRGGTGTATGVAGPVAGALSLGPSGIRVGAKPAASSTEPFTGDVDELRLYRTALSPAQIAGLATAAGSADPVTGADAGLVLRLPFTVVDQAGEPVLEDVAGVDDESGHCADAWVLGGAAARRDGAAGVGGIGQSLAVDSGHPGVEAPMTPSLDLGAGDFTLSMWFAYSASAGTPDQALLWAYGMNSDPQMWVQARPSSGSISAWVQTDTGRVSPTVSASAFGDGLWHQLVLRRSGGTVTLTVRGAAASDPVYTATSTGLTGSLTSGRATGVRGLRIGSRIDGAKVMDGRVDEFRLYPSALDDAALETVHAGGGLGADSAATVRWSFDSKYTYAVPASRPEPAATATTPDVSGRCDNGYLLGGAGIEPGARNGGGALHLDGSGSVLVPRGADLALQAEAVAGTPADPGESADFSVAAWFRYSAGPATPDQVLVWGYGAVSGARQLWLRARPSADQLTATVQTGQRQVQVTAPDGSAATAFGDGAWHQVVLARAGDTVTLYVDKAALGTVTLGPGDLTATDGFAADGLRLGAKPDGTDPLTGYLDDVQVFRQGLDGAAVAASYDTGAVPYGPALVMSLPFDIRTDQSTPRM
ncbi:LamG-like jellyroll fold domain-containing protein [Actinacidiphila rubida]|uniref:exo-alpha-sialidase n=1 Tax=Actinacidiphila rubida TaxID=310780 RepID=A0A1H8S0Y3_9ACTN|nr:LamG-like jellyroll fold domain-containing protein [Actinacidiphila rubida]SEO72295.1 sialidase-1 [Actinacidiphila rubida]